MTSQKQKNEGWNSKIIKVISKKLQLYVLESGKKTKYKATEMKPKDMKL